MIRRLLPVGISAVAIAGVLAATAAVTALAYFTTAGNGESAPTEVSQLAKPVVTAVPGTDGTVALSWTEVSAPGGTGAVRYSIRRNGGKSGGSCNSILSVTTCVDSGLEPGGYEYVVTARWRSWTAESSAGTATITAGPADHLTLTAASSTPTAGAADNLTVTARDAQGNTVTSYTGSHAITFSGAVAAPNGTAPTVASSSGAAVGFGNPTALNFSAGVASVSSAKNGAMKLYKSGAAAIEASDGSISTETPASVTVSPAAASSLWLGAASTTPAAGASDNLTITALDDYENTAASYTGSKSLAFSGASAAPDGTTPTVTNSSGSKIAFGDTTTISFSAGVATTTGTKNGVMRLYKSGSASLRVTDGTLTTPSALAVTVGATATRFALTAATTAPAAGASDNLTITAQDAYENTATSYAGSKNLVFSGAVAIGSNNPTVVNSSGTAVAFGSATSIAFTSGAATVTSSKNGLMKIYAAGEADIEVSDGTISTETPLAVKVSPLAASKFVLAAGDTTPAAGEVDGLTVTAEDAYGNVAIAYTGSKSLTFSGASAAPDGTAPTVTGSSGAATAFGSATAITFEEGAATVSGTKNGVMRLYKSGSASLRVTDGTLTTPSALAVTVAAAESTGFLLASSASALTAKGSANLTITAQDTYENTDTTYTGSHNLIFSGASASPNATAPTVSSSGGAATAFGSATAISFSAGVAKVSSSKNGLMKLYRAETAEVSVSDGSLSSAAIAVSVSPNTASKWALTNIDVSAGAQSSNCLFTCTVTGLGNSGTVEARVAVTDAYGNTVSALGSGHVAKVTVTTGSGTIVGSPLAIPSTGAAETATTFTFTSRSSGNFTERITAAAQEGTAYTKATLTATR